MESNNEVAEILKYEEEITGPPTGGAPDERPIADVLRAAETALAAHPGSPKLWFAVATVLDNRRFHDKALDYYRKALELIETSNFSVNDMSEDVSMPAWMVRERVGMLYAELGDFKQAYSALGQAISEKPEQSPGWKEVLTIATAIGVDLEDFPGVEQLVERIVARADADNAIVFDVATRRREVLGSEDAESYMQNLVDRHPELTTEPSYEAWRQPLGKVRPA